MIIFLLILSVIAFAATFVFAKKSWQTGLSIVCGCIFVGSIVLMTLNFTNHFGMKKVTETATVELDSSADIQGVDILLYQPLGEEEKVYVYQATTNKDATTTEAEHTVNHIEQGSDKATLDITTSYWDYKDSFYQLLFGITKGDGELIEITNDFHLPDSWEVVSVDQIKALQTVAKEHEAELETEAGQYIQEKMKASQPMDEAQQKKAIQQWTAEFQAQKMHEMLAEVKDK
ncbi:DUF4811 domain-containing protein [Enterococcus saccharolyticus]|uniref:DUF4811 domain-containing protein n=1 Tax=Enterococcus saccharolyticus TaxID=41997 RepID=UPI001E5567AF|nr:DUF4811 domain-containing protein [Enterococcus saccharolyticus]MCD5001977.1 DUF4811 domain-containing protein [Enterococcus saccharolyticus]